MGGANQFRIFTSEEKRIDEWKYGVIIGAREWFYQHKTDDEAYNKQLMTRIIRGDKQAGAQSAVVSYFIKKKMWGIVKKGIKWYDVQTDLQWTIYLDCYRAAVTDPSNPNLPMLDRLMAAMSRIPDIGRWKWRRWKCWGQPWKRVYWIWRGMIISRTPKTLGKLLRIIGTWK
jgi:hypothetical protein